MNSLEMETMTRVLVVDDEPMVADFVGEVAEDCGYEVGKARSAVEFYDKYRSVHPDVVLLDLVLPGVDGVMLLRFLQDEASQARIVIMSGLGKKVIDAAVRLGRARGLNMGRSVTKPIELAEFEMLLTRPWESLE